MTDELDEDDTPIEIELLTPEECGWVRVSDRKNELVYEKPDGTFHVFPPRGNPAIMRLKGGWPPKWYGTNGQ